RAQPLGALRRRELLDLSHEASVFGTTNLKLRIRLERRVRQDGTRFRIEQGVLLVARSAGVVIVHSLVEGSRARSVDKRRPQSRQRASEVPVVDGYAGTERAVEPNKRGRGVEPREPGGQGERERRRPGHGRVEMGRARGERLRHGIEVRGSGSAEGGGGGTWGSGATRWAVRNGS